MSTARLLMPCTPSCVGHSMDWEYRVEYPRYDKSGYPESLSDMLNRLAAEGWEPLMPITSVSSREVTDPYSSARGQMASYSSTSFLLRRAKA